MMGVIRTAYALCMLSILTPIVNAVTSIKVEGSNFVNSKNAERFQMIGVAYQPGGASGFDPSSKKDPLSNAVQCLRDAALMQRLGLNTIRVYNLDPSLNHDECASIFNAVGIYMLLDVNSPLPGQALDRGTPSKTYTVDYLKRIFAVVEAFKNYPNTLGFFAGNEVINDGPSGAATPPYLRAVNRDLKNYIAKHANRTIPVGYSAADVRELLAPTWEYLQCAIDGDADDKTRTDFFGLNSYSWCGVAATYKSSGYDDLVKLFGNTTVPVFFSEYGCNTSPPRTFNEMKALYGPKMTPVMSGGLIYEFTQEDSNYGLVNLRNDGSVKLRDDYGRLQQQISKLDINKLETANSTAKSLKPPKCEASLVKHGDFSTSFKIPDLPKGGQDLINHGIPKPNVGKLVPITSTQVSQKVESSNGKPFRGLAIKPLPSDQSNVPAGQGSSGPAPSPTPASTGSSPSSSPSKKSAASSSLLLNSAVLVLGCAVAGLFVM